MLSAKAFNLSGTRLQSLRKDIHWFTYQRRERLTLFLFTSASDVNRTDTSEGEAFRISDTDLILVFHPLKKPLSIKDILILLIESIFSATQKINAGGKAAADPVEVFAHKYGRVQMQVIGFRGLLGPYKCAEIFNGLATIGAKTGYYESSVTVYEDRLGAIALVYMR
ncbi:MAG: hypothetical protein Q9166_008103 [cf. Caloplaca sp. 2 TL-2023]